MKKRKKILSLLLCAVTCASMTGSTVSAAEFDEAVVADSADISDVEEDTDVAADDAEVSEIAETFDDAESEETAEDISDDVPDDTFNEEAFSDAAEVSEASASEDSYTSAEGTFPNGIKYTLKDGVFTVTGKGNLPDQDETGIDKMSWDEMANTINSIVVSDGITSVSDLFACSSVKTVTLGADVKEIAPQAFYFCNNLASINIPLSVVSIGFNAFCGCTNVKSTYPGTAQQWYNIDINSGNEYLLKNTTTSTASTIIVDQGICDQNLNWTLDSAGLLTISGNGDLTAFPWTDKVQYHTFNLCISDGITSISCDTFRYSQLETIKLGSDIKEIGDDVFLYCTKLTTINIPASVTSIGSNAFNRCQNIQATYAGTPEQWEKISIADGNELLQKSVTGKEVTIASGSCGPNLCWSIDTSGLLSITGTGEMTSHPWTYNYSYSKVNIQSGCTSLCYDAFWGSGDSRTIYIPKTVTYIDEYALFSKGEPHVVNYEGTQKEWGKITKGQGNDFITLNCLADILQQKENTLKDLLNYLKTLQKDDYISGWNELQEAIKNAEAELNSNTFTAESLEKQINELHNAQYALLYKPHWSMNFKDNICEKTYGAAAFQIPLLTNAPATLITYKSSNPKVAVISSTGKITIKGTGVTNITATAATDSTHFKSSIVYTVYINPGNTTVSLTAKTMTYTGKAYNGLKVTTKGSNGKRTYYYYTDAACKKPVTKANSGAAKTLNAAPVYAGTYYAKVQVDKNSNYYEAYSKTVKFTIKKATPVIAAKSASKTVSYTKLKKAKQTFKLSATATGKNKITFRKTSGSKNIAISKTGTVTVPAKTKKGTYTIKVKLTTKSSRNYNAAKAKTVTLKVVVK